jgi:LCP family protein required for cell wall assembly
MSFTVRHLKEKTPPKKPAANRLNTVLSILSVVTGPLLQIGHMWREKQEKKKKHDKRVNLLKRVFIILLAIFCAALLFMGTAKALVALKVLSLQNIVGVAGSDLPHDAHGHTNILLLGQGDASHDGIDLTDTVMIASLDPEKTQSAVMLSLPRDLYFLETENMGKGRINSLYRDYKIILKREGKTEGEASHLAMRELANEIGRALGMEIHHIVKVDFIGFVQAVDAIGGIDIVVPATLVDTEYPGPNYTYETFSISAGPQHLDGETALKYARSRHSTSDFDRSARQQQILQAIADKVKSEGILTKPGQILDLLNIMEEHVLTTLQVRDMVSLAGTGKDIDRSKLIGMQLNTTNGLYGATSEPGGILYTPPRDQFGGAAVLLPVSIPEYPVTWKQVQALVQLLIHDRTAHVERTPIRIWNTGAEPGSARRLGGELIRYGFNVIATENAPERRERPDSVIVASGSGVTASVLNELLGYPVESPQVSHPGTGAAGSSIPSTSSLPSMPSDIIIELGEDFEYTQLQNRILPSTP